MSVCRIIFAVREISPAILTNKAHETTRQDPELVCPDHLPINLNVLNSMEQLAKNSSTISNSERK